MSRVASNRSNIPRSSSSVTGFAGAAGAVACQTDQVTRPADQLSMRIWLTESK